MMFQGVAQELVLKATFWMWVFIRTPSQSYKT